MCPYKPVADRPDQFESKTVEGAIYNCPLGRVFDFESFPCGCVMDENPERTIAWLRFRLTYVVIIIFKLKIKCN